MILLGTDVLIDVALDRDPHAAAAVEVLERIELGFERAAIAWQPLVRAAPDASSHGT